jgi:hypothetical protein
MKALVAICIALLFLLSSGCTKQSIKTDKEAVKEEPKEVPPWSRFPMPDEDKEENEDE